MLNEVALSKQQDQIVLWGTSVSPYVRKVMVALAEKGITYDHQEVLPKSLLLAKNLSDDLDRQKTRLLQLDPYLPV